MKEKTPHELEYYGIAHDGASGGLILQFKCKNCGFLLALGSVDKDMNGCNLNNESEVKKRANLIGKDYKNICKDYCYCEDYRRLNENIN